MFGHAYLDQSTNTSHRMDTWHSLRLKLDVTLAECLYIVIDSVRSLAPSENATFHCLTVAREI